MQEQTAVAAVTGAIDPEALKHLPASLLADNIGQLDARIAALKEERDPMASELKRRGVGVYVGQLYQCNVYEQERETLIADVVKKYLKKYLGPKQYEKCFRITKSISLRADARK